MKNFIIFALIGGFVLTTENLLVALGMWLGVNFLYLRLCSAVVCLILSYFLNCLFNFRVVPQYRTFVLFVYGAILGYSISYIVSVVFYYGVFGSRYALSATNLGALVALGANFCYQRLVTFRNSTA